MLGQLEESQWQVVAGYQTGTKPNLRMSLLHFRHIIPGPEQSEGV